MDKEKSISKQKSDQKQSNSFIGKSDGSPVIDLNLNATKFARLMNGKHFLNVTLMDFLNELQEVEDDN